MKNKKYIAGILIFQVIICILFSKSYALDPQTHKDLNEYIAYNTIDGFSFDLFLQDQLGLQAGIEESVNSKRIWEWLRDGGYYEDKPPKFIPYVRSFKHYHNPLTDQGYKGLESSVQWSQKPIGSQSPTGWSGNYSWHDVRNYFYNALIATDQTTRDGNFADTFRGLGQLMHLVQDLSVPAHTRDDAHFLKYEYWVKHNVKYNESQNIDNIYDYRPFISFDKSAIGNVNSQASVPVANLFDTDQYVEPNPDPSKTLQSDIGLSEYTNANFLSSGTIPGTIFDGDFPYPILANHLFGGSCELQYFDIEDPRNPTQTVKRPYWVKVAHGATGYRLSTFPYLARSIFGLENFNTASLDGHVYKDYADQLIPRTVGYSAGLLDYFFRGTIKITAPDRFVYSIIDGSIVDGSYEVDGNIIETQTFNYIRAKLRNTSEEEMGSGTLIAVAKYKRRKDYKPDLSTDPPTPESREADFSYSVSQPINIASLDSGYAKEFTFDFSNDPIPASITDLYLQVVFKGILGNETGTAIAVGMKDINEPQHILMVNSTDRVYLNHTLYTADQVRNNPDLVGLLEDEYLDPYDDMDIGMAFYVSSFPTALHAAGLTMQAPGYGRAIILADEPYFYYYVQWASPSRGHADFGSALMAGVINQENSQGGFDDTQVQTFRGINAHLVRWVCWTNPDADGIMSADWPTMESEQPYALGIWP